MLTTATNRKSAPHWKSHPSDGTMATEPTCESFDLSVVENGDLLSIATKVSSSDESTDGQPSREQRDKDFETESSHGFFLVPSISKGRHSIPLQASSRKYLKFLFVVPVISILSSIFVAYFWFPLLSNNGFYEFLDTFLWDTILANRLASTVLLIVPMITGIVWDIISEVWTFAMLVRGRQHRYLPDTMPRLLHAVIICNYKEPGNMFGFFAHRASRSWNILL